MISKIPSPDKDDKTSEVLSMGDEWQPVESNRNFWNPTKEGEELIGKLVGISDGLYGKRYTILTNKDGKDEEIGLPSHKMLQGLMAPLGIGDMVKIVFKETQSPKVKGQSPLRVYEVYRKPVATEERVQ